MDTFSHDAPENPIVVLTSDESWELLDTQRLGRLVVSIQGRIEVYPVNFITHEGKILFRTAEGSKLVELTIFPDVAFQVDHVAAESAWSVLVRGTARRLTTSSEILEADKLQLHSWVPTPKYNYVEIAPGEVSGRRVRLEPHE